MQGNEFFAYVDSGCQLRGSRLLSVIDKTLQDVIVNDVTMEMWENKNLNTQLETLAQLSVQQESNKVQTTL